SAADHGPTGANAADAATPGRLGTGIPPADRSQVTGGLESNLTPGFGSRAAAFCCASPAVPRAEAFPETDASAIRSTASAVVSITAYRHRVSFAILPLRLAHERDDRHAGGRGLRSVPGFLSSATLWTSCPGP